jgi:multiple sugar transport system substrate-binding protein
MKRVATATVLLAATLSLTACTHGGGGSKNSSGSGSNRSSGSSSKPVKLTAWVGWSAGTHELKAFKSLVDEYNAKHKDIHVNVVGDINDTKIIAAIRSGTAPDIVSSFNSYNVGNYCGTGGWIDLSKYLKADHIDVNGFPPATRYYTQFDGKRCALPLLADTYGLYYNKTLFAKAGIKRPPRTISELTADAKKLTQRSGNGSITVAGIDPLIGFYENVPERWGTSFGVKWLDSDNQSIISKDPGWKKLFNWHKSLVDWYGYSKLARFQAGLGDEFSASQAFEKGKLAMNLDGEWRVAFIADEHPELKYGTAPMPVDDAHPELYGSGYINGTIIGIPRGAKHPDESWKVVRYLTTNPHFLAQFSNKIRNVPTTKASLNSPEIKPDPHFATFLKIFANPHSTTSPIMASGQAYTNLVQNFFTKWQAGGVHDLEAGLKKLDKQLDAQVEQAGGGGGGVP